MDLSRIASRVAGQCPLGDECSMTHTHCELCDKVVEEDAEYTDPAMCKACRAKNPD